MSHLLHTKVATKADNTLTLELTQIHPDARLNPEFSFPLGYEKEIQQIGLVLLVDLLYRTNHKNHLLVQQSSYVMDMKVPTDATITQFLQDGNVLELQESNIWEMGYFDNLSSAEIREPQHWEKLPKAILQLIFKNVSHLKGIEIGLETETTFDTKILDWFSE